MADLTPPEGIVERLAELAVAFGANVRKGQIVGLTAELGGHEPLVRAIAEQAYRHGARFVDVNWFDPHVKRARIQHTVDADSLEIRAAVVRQPGAGARARRRRHHRRQRRHGARPSRRPRPRARGSRPPAGDQGVRRRHQRAERELDDRPLRHGGVGAARPPGRPARGGLRDAVGRGRARLPPRRGRPGRSVEQPDGRERARCEPPDRAQLRRASVPRADDRSRARPPADVEVAPHALLDRGRARPPPEHPLGGGVHLPRPAAGRRLGRVDEAARAQRRLRRARPARPLRGRARGRDRGGRGRADAQRADRRRRGRTPARRGGAGRPRGPDRAARHRLLRHAPRRERREPHRTRQRLPVGGRRGGRAAREHQRCPRRLHDRQRRRRRHRRDAGRAARFPSCAAAPGRSSALPPVTGL